MANTDANTDEFAGFQSAGALPSSGAQSSPADEFEGFADANPPAPPERSIGSEALHQGAQLLKGAGNAVAALPLMAMDAGVATRNVVGDAANKALGNPATPDYDLPSTGWYQGMNQIFGAPENTMEKVNDVAVPMILSAGAASEGAPGLIRSMMSGPTSATKVPANFMNAADQKRQLLAQTIQRGQDLGLVVPPQTTNPNALNASVETVGGKIQTAQGASVHNQPIANAVAAKELGLNPDAPITENSLRQVIKDAGKGYEAVRGVGPIHVDPQYLQTLTDVASRAAGPAASFPGSKASPLIGEVDSLLQPSFDSSHAVDKIAELRDASSVAYRQGDSRLGAGYRQLSKALEDQIDRGISTNPNVSPHVVDNFRASRVLAAQAHSVLDALNPSNGNVSIQSLAKSEDPLTGGLKVLSDFGNAAPKATQDIEKIGSHGVSHLDTLGTMFTGAFGEHVAGPWGMAAGAAYPAARWGARAYALGPGQAGALPKVVLGGASNPKTAAAATQAIINGGNSIQRASGGKVDLDSLVSKLMTRWKSAKKETDKTTRPFLQRSDDSIIRALHIAQENI